MDGGEEAAVDEEGWIEREGGNEEGWKGDSVGKEIEGSQGQNKMEEKRWQEEEQRFEVIFWKRKCWFRKTWQEVNISLAISLLNKWLNS